MKTQVRQRRESCGSQSKNLTRFPQETIEKAASVLVVWNRGSEAILGYYNEVFCFCKDLLSAESNCFGPQLLEVWVWSKPNMEQGIPLAWLVLALLMSMHLLGSMGCYCPVPLESWTWWLGAGTYGLPGKTTVQRQGFFFFFFLRQIKHWTVECIFLTQFALTDSNLFHTYILYNYQNKLKGKTHSEATVGIRTGCSTSMGSIRWNLEQLWRNC